MRLSILIPTLHERSDMLLSLKAALYGQISMEKLEEDVEILCLADNREKPTGWKRNMLLQKAKGDYVCFIDDDDEIHQNYVRLIYIALMTSPDVVGIVLNHYVNDHFVGTAYHTKKYKEWKNIQNQEDPGTWLFERCPNHLNPVRRNLALHIRYPEIYVGEDREYSVKLCPNLKDEVMINEPIYFYKEVK